MNENIVSQMENFVADVMKSNQSDFFKHDKPHIERLSSDEFPVLWWVAELHTWFVSLGEFVKGFQKYEEVRYNWSRHNTMHEACMDCMSKDDHLFLITCDEIREITKAQGEEVIRDIITPFVVEWKRKGGEIPMPTAPKIKFEGISLSELKTLINECRERGNDSLMNHFKALREYRRFAQDHYFLVTKDWERKYRCTEYTDGKEGLVVGIVFHGWSESGYIQNGSCQISPEYGWHKHT